MRNAALIFVALAVTGCESSRFVYSSEAGLHDIHSAVLGRDGAKRVTANLLPDRFPRCSSDGRLLVFARGDGAAREIVLFDRRSRQERPLTRDSVLDSSPSWSPDGHFVYFTRREGSRDRIARIPAGGGPIEFLTDGSAHDTMPSVSPSGRLLVHHTYRYGRETELQLLDLETGNSRRLTNSAGSDYEASFEREDRVVFSSNRDGGHHRLYRLHLGDGRTELLADTGEDAWGPRYSRRGGVLFYTGKPGAWRLFRLSSAASGPEPVDVRHVSAYGADWCGG